MIEFIILWVVLGSFSRVIIELYKDEHPSSFPGHKTKRKDILYGPIFGWFSVMFCVWFFARELYRSTRSGKLREWLNEEL